MECDALMKTGFNLFMEEHLFVFFLVDCYGTDRNVFISLGELEMWKSKASQSEGYSVVLIVEFVVKVYLKM